MDPNTLLCFVDTSIKLGNEIGAESEEAIDPSRIPKVHITVISGDLS